MVAGADVELFLLDAWGELSVGAQLAGADGRGAAERDDIVGAMRAAVERAGSPWWAVATEHRWALERGIAAGDTVAVTDAAAALVELAERHPAVVPDAENAANWVAVLAGRVSPIEVAATSARLVGAGRRWEAATLCRAAVARAADPAAARELAGTGRALRTAAAPGRTAGDLSDREREVGALVIDGLTHREIGARLYISPKTVEQHVARLRQKLAASNRAALVAGLRVCLQAS